MKNSFITNNWTVILLIVILLIIAGAAFAKQNRKKKEGEIDEIRRRINEGVGQNGVDIKTVLGTTQADTNFNGELYAIQIYNAKSWINDDEDAVYKALGGKTKSQVAAIYQAFRMKYQMELDSYLNPRTGFMNEEEYNNVVNIVRNSN